MLCNAVALFTPQLFPRLQELTRSCLAVVSSTCAAAAAELDLADLAKRVNRDVMGSMLLDQNFGGMDMK